MTNFAKKRSQLQERRIADDLGGQVQKNSGATDFAKGDVRVQGQLGVEAKHTSKKSFTLSLADIMKIRNEALARGESWVMQVEFVGQAGMSQKVAVLNWDEYVSLRQFMDSDSPCPTCGRSPRRASCPLKCDDV